MLVMAMSITFHKIFTFPVSHVVASKVALTPHYALLRCPLFYILTSFNPFFFLIFRYFPFFPIASSIQKVSGSFQVASSASYTLPIVDLIRNLQSATCPLPSKTWFNEATRTPKRLPAWTSGTPFPRMMSF